MDSGNRCFLPSSLQLWSELNKNLNEVEFWLKCIVFVLYFCRILLETPQRTPLATLDFSSLQRDLLTWLSHLPIVKPARKDASAAAMQIPRPLSCRGLAMASWARECSGLQQQAWGLQMQSRGWTGDFATTQRLRKTAPRRLLSLPAVEGRAPGGAATQSSDYLLKRPTRAFCQLHPKKDVFVENLTDEFLIQLSYSSDCYLNTLRLSVSWASSVTSRSLNPLTPNPRDWVRPNSSHTHPPHAYLNRPPHFCISIAEVLTHPVGIM